LISLFQKQFNRIAKIIAATLLAALFITFLLQIFSRYVLNSPFGWTLELCRILWVWIVFFCCAFLVREKDHVRFNLLYSGSSKKTKFVMNERAEEFVASNMDQLAKEIAMGHGESVDTLAELLAVEDKEAFASALQANYNSIYSADNVEMAEVLDSISAS